MRLLGRNIVFYVLTIFFFESCATVPSVKVAQPWNRSLRGNESVKLAGRIKVEVTGTTTPLLGKENLLSAQIRETLTSLLKRRGFVVDESMPDYLIQLTYKTDRVSKLESSSSVSSRSVDQIVSSTTSGAGATSGLGVSIARAITALTSKSTASAQQSTEEVFSYTHTLSIEITNRKLDLIWKGESTWDSDELNLISQIIPALQSILSDLPSDRTIKPEMPEVKLTHIDNFYKLKCEDIAFSCPALPYRIFVAEHNALKDAKTSIANSVKNPYALAAYLDLIQTAEYAIPDGDEQDWKDPIQVSLWRKTTLGGQYLIGSKKTPVNIIIKLSGKSEGYYLDDCQVVSDEEYAKFQEQLSKWQSALADYYDVYVR